MRCFIAVDLEQSLTKKIQQLQNQLKCLDVKLVEQNNLHFTLKFLDEIQESAVNDVKEKLTELASSTQAFSINLHGVGVFPSEKYIRVIWVGAENREFADLHNAVNNALAKMFKKEKSSPHLTIARVRPGCDDHKIAEFLERHKNTEIGSMIVDTLRLKKSILMESGPIYEDIATFELVKN